ncbi:fasciclin domain-containing protein [Azohydromonas sp.]|uniref:fasciclin domain-containing protein n=1 Tax=Azohydromonas sp. TaxID=1872666 RepID=UPI002C2ACE52|nr:fasciclin domain-containing protein [Azohydromonas sp.]HMM84522.1 fasciclin domain-containing protein [Azohydromonas sp.]
MPRWLKSLIAVTSVALLAACGGGDDDPKHITATVQDTPRFSVLSEAITAAGLEATLRGPGPFTVFAPTNDAFTALLGELGVTKDQLLADKALLTQVLTYHVVAGEVPKAAVPLGQPITTVQGAIFKVDTVGAELVITDGRNRSAKITATDVDAENGVIHVVDRVILPANRNVVETAVALASASPAEFTILVEAVVAADLAGVLSGSGPFTVFAPTDAAFAALLGELGVTKDQLLADKDLLTAVLAYHVVPGRVLKAQVPVGTAIATVQGGSFSVDTSLQITDGRDRRAAIVATDVLATNGVIHVIDKVILPSP